MNPGKDSVFEVFLERQYEEGMALATESQLLRLHPLAGTPPWTYIARFRCRGLAKNPAGLLVEHDCWDIGIQFPPHYLRAPVHPSQILAFLGTGQGSQLAPFHPNIRDCFICLDVTVGMALTEILYALFDLLTWRLYSTRDEGLNHEAAQYARQQPPGRFPLDARALKRPMSGALNVETISAPS